MFLSNSVDMMKNLTVWGTDCIYVFYDLTWLYGPIAAGAALVLTITLFKVPLELMIFDDFEVC